MTKDEQQLKIKMAEKKWMEARHPEDIATWSKILNNLIMMEVEDDPAKSEEQTE